MNSKLWAANLGFLPRSVDFALLFLRISLGVSMIVLHGWDKLTGFRTVAETFPDPIGLGRHMTLILALASELVCSAMLVIGALSRLAAAVLAINMGVALFIVHHGDLSRTGGGEPAALYLIGYLTVLLAGGGRFSADGAGGPWALAAFGAVAGAVLGYPLSYAFQPRDHTATGSLSDYLANIRTVLRDDRLNAWAIGVWGAAILLFFVAGFIIGRAMHRKRVRTMPPPPPKA